MISISKIALALALALIGRIGWQLYAERDLRICKALIAALTKILPEEMRNFYLFEWSYCIEDTEGPTYRLFVVMKFTYSAFFMRIEIEVESIVARVLRMLPDLSVPLKHCARLFSTIGRGIVVVGGVVGLSLSAVSLTTITLSSWTALMLSYSVKNAKGGGTPIVLDTNRNGKIDVTGHSTSRIKNPYAAVGRSVIFNLYGTPKRYEWIDGSGDGFLIRNNDGLAAVDMGGHRLFKNGWGLNGYEELADYDLNGDGTLAGDEIDGLALWVDDGDARVQDGEIQTLLQHNIAEISVNFRIEFAAGHLDHFDVTISSDYDDVYEIYGKIFDEQLVIFERSSATTTSGEIILTEDVWFVPADEGNTELLTLFSMPARHEDGVA